MQKDPQNIIKLSSQNTDGEYLQMVFDSEQLTYQEVTEKFYDFLRGVGYVIEYTGTETSRS